MLFLWTAPLAHFKNMLMNKKKGYVCWVSRELVFMPGPQLLLFITWQNSRH